jgi:hypothetical protein
MSSLIIAKNRTGVKLARTSSRAKCPVQRLAMNPDQTTDYERAALDFPGAACPKVDINDGIS